MNFNYSKSYKSISIAAPKAQAEETGLAFIN